MEHLRRRERPPRSMRSETRPHERRSKSGWHRAEDGTRIHWAFAEFDIQDIDYLPEMLRPFRFEPEIAPNGEIDGVLLIGFG